MHRSRCCCSTSDSRSPRRDRGADDQRRRHQQVLRLSAVFRPRIAIPQFAGFLDELKLRAAYGQSGTQPLYGVRYTPLATTVDAGACPVGCQDTCIGDPNIKPESETEIETGVRCDDVPLARAADRSPSTRSGSRTCCCKRGSMRRAGTTPSGSMVDEFTNQGAEISLTATPVQLRNGFTWVSTTSFYRNYSVVNSLAVAPV